MNLPQIWYLMNCQTDLCASLHSNIYSKLWRERGERKDSYPGSQPLSPGQCGSPPSTKEVAFPQLPVGTPCVAQWPSSEVMLRREGSSLRIHFPCSKALSRTDFCFSVISVLSPFWYDEQGPDHCSNSSASISRNPDARNLSVLVSCKP